MAKGKTKVKDKHKGYRISIGVISIVLGCLLLSAYGNNDGSGLGALGVPGLLGLISGITQLSIKDYKKSYIVSGILLFIGAGLNIISIMDISIYSIYAIIIGVFNMVFANDEN